MIAASARLSYRVVIPAAGAGSRMGSATPKQYLPLLGRTVIEWALLPFIEDVRCQSITVALAADDAWQASIALFKTSKIRLCEGGVDRASSVEAGLKSLCDETPPEAWVLVHDAARPCLDVHDLNDLLAIRDADDSIVGGLLATPVADTLKRADEHHHVSATISRAGLWRAQTPQMFRLGLLQQALQQAREQHLEITDEASAIEAMGLKPKLVAGRADNLKITFPEDLALAEMILLARRGIA